jgi:hypothetical protein
MQHPRGHLPPFDHCQNHKGIALGLVSPNHDSVSAQMGAHEGHLFAVSTVPMRM